MGFKANGNQVIFEDEKSGFSYIFTAEELMQAGIDLSKKTANEVAGKLQNFMNGLSLNISKYSNEIDSITYFLDTIYKDVKPGQFEAIETGTLGWIEIGTTLGNSLIYDYNNETEGKNVIWKMFQTGVS